MILATDVHYSKNTSTAAGILFKNWDAAEASDIVTAYIPEVAEYIPGQFYKRELPCLLALLQKLPTEPDCIVVDGFVYLDNAQKPGLGKYLYDALEARIPIVGVQSLLLRVHQKNAEYCAEKAIILCISPQLE